MNTKDMSAAVLPAIGAAIAGGFYAGCIQIEGINYGLVVAPKDGGEREDVAWLESEKRVTGADSYNDGLQNTTAMGEAGSELAQWARGLQIGGHADWYIPSQDELEVAYRNLKPTKRENYCYGRSGTNPSATPPTHPYSRAQPVQTSVEAFAEGGEQAFASEWYWTSTQHASDDDCAWFQYFYYGYQDNDGKSAELRARAVRRFAI